MYCGRMDRILHISSMTRGKLLENSVHVSLLQLIYVYIGNDLYIYLHVCCCILYILYRGFFKRHRDFNSTTSNLIEEFR